MRAAVGSHDERFNEDPECYVVNLVCACVWRITEWLSKTKVNWLDIIRGHFTHGAVIIMPVVRISLVLKSIPVRILDAENPSALNVLKGCSCITRWLWLTNWHAYIFNHWLLHWEKGKLLAKYNKNLNQIKIILINFSGKKIYFR